MTVDQLGGGLPPFQLRPNKFVDRMMFVDLINCVIGECGADQYKYISMGATFLHDHHLVYRRTGIENLVSFGNDSDDIKRQIFNRPTDRMICEPMDSSELRSQLVELRGDANVIIWLDFMSSKERRLQLQQTEEVLAKLQPGDLFRVTLNAEYRKFGKFDDVEKEKFANVAGMAAFKLKKQIGEYLPSGLNKVEPSMLSALLAGAVQRAAERALKHRPDIAIVPVLSTSYADGDRMITVACAVRHKSPSPLPEAIRRWKYRSKGWADFTNINVPDLSLREKYFIDRRIKMIPSRIMKSLPFCPDEDAAADSLLSTVKSYRSLHRYYPTFYNFDN